MASSHTSSLFGHISVPPIQPGPWRGLRLMTDSNRTRARLMSPTGISEAFISVFVRLVRYPLGSTDVLVPPPATDGAPDVSCCCDCAAASRRTCITLFLAAPMSAKLVMVPSACSAPAPPASVAMPSSCTSVPICAPSRAPASTVSGTA
ncbi:hypothetical protein KC330_g169 [Hortaea werneckii]|nr:hypothetical protein KC330_g169 [Hortaea werneckii]